MHNVCTVWLVCGEQRVDRWIFFLFLCRIDEDYNLKITDNALSRDLFPSDYHCLGDNENRPVKWMAVESLVHKKFSHASDVVSIRETLIV